MSDVQSEAAVQKPPRTPTEEPEPPAVSDDLVHHFASSNLRQQQSSRAAIVPQDSVRAEVSTAAGSSTQVGCSNSFLNPTLPHNATD